MAYINKLKILNDPIYGFVTIPNSLVYDLIEHPYFQRLRRISQMGVSYLVYPGAHHTRFHHALGCMHLMQKAVQVLRFKSVSISEEEENALYVAILLHDIGHGPFSHAMEESIVEGVHHEEISILFMNRLNKEFNGKLDLAIKIFKGEYHRKFMLQLISGQLDMDRMDYLKRDSFYSGVAEGNINSERLIQMLNVVNDELVVEKKGIYSVEMFLIARRLMYWQAYLHKTSVCAELILVRVLKRAKELTHKGVELWCSESLQFFLKNQIDEEDFDNIGLEKFALLDDSDILGALKSWQFHNDFILSELSKMIINRELLRIEFVSDKEETKLKLNNMLEKVSKKYSLSAEASKYFVFKGKMENQAYSKDKEPIMILKKDGTTKDVLSVSDELNLKSLTKVITKYFVCYPKNVFES
ncbi:HD domain-containing protein [Myroides marinus]|uniref:HD domain-containing protein n=1 Tax=Myroides marinus TaxID=703342 RepID=A0A1H6T687_9FLAO|nr:HD domain-containing protein [Myroides marinus]MDR0194326.1 HD domain-containing protein [Myroides sp.]MDM1346713.1 HD domain-containing protein [Myroides marinus]MDM1350100.1 HD domain-containing protein [Myroides marinus]MDM1355125.1 HD domain-containing protein [Myroides marinus]MDM1357281.1 HD domain-containing protein [Myroides marinus]